VNGIVVVIGINIIAFFGIFFYFKRRIDKSLKTEEVINSIRKEIEQLILELNQTTNRNVDIIEDRIQNLKEVIASADKQVKILNREIQKKAKETDTYANIKPVFVKNKPSQKTVEKNPRTTRDRVITLFYKGENIEDISKDLGITLAEVELIISLNSRKGL